MWAALMDSRLAVLLLNVSKPFSLGTGCDTPTKVPSGVYAVIPFLSIEKKVSLGVVLIESLVCIPCMIH